MMNEQHIELITAWLEGSLTPEQRMELNELIDRGAIDILDIKEMELLYKKLDKLPSAEPGPELRDRFYDMLEAEKENQASSLSVVMTGWLDRLRSGINLRQAAFAVSIFMGGILIGNWTTPFQNYRQQLDQLSGEISHMREVMMLSLLDASSPTERLKAINISTDIRSADNRIVEALLKTLNNDPNVNVRLASIEALLQHATNPLVREGLINAISNQQSPQVQVALADAMLVLQEKESIKKLRELLDRNELDHNVRDKLQRAIAALS